MRYKRKLSTNVEIWLVFFTVVKPRSCSCCWIGQLRPDEYHDFEEKRREVKVEVCFRASTGHSPLPSLPLSLPTSATIVLHSCLHHLLRFPAPSLNLPPSACSLLLMPSSAKNSPQSLTDNVFVYCYYFTELANGRGWPHIIEWAVCSSVSLLYKKMGFPSIS